MYDNIIQELKDLRKNNPIRFLKELNKYKTNNPAVYDAIIKHISINESSDEPTDMMRTAQKPGPLQIKPEAHNLTELEKDLNFNWTLAVVFLGLLMLIIVFIILFLIS